jgi:hypothetical protein
MMTTYAPAVQALIEPPRLAELGPGKPNSAARARLDSLSDDALFAGREVVDRNMADACRAGLWLYHDFLDRSHEISQEIDTPSGSYWHAILHRREPDYGNAKYWFRRVGSHPVFAPLAKAACVLARESAPQSFLASQNEWDSFRFVDLCQHVIGSGSSEESLGRAIQEHEWRLLFDHCYQAALAS